MLISHGKRRNRDHLRVVTKCRRKLNSRFALSEGMAYLDARRQAWHVRQAGFAVADCRFLFAGETALIALLASHASQRETSATTNAAKRGSRRSPSGGACHSGRERRRVVSDSGA